MAAGGGFDVAQEGWAGIGAKTGVDGPWLDQTDMHAGADQL